MCHVIQSANDVFIRRWPIEREWETHQWSQLRTEYEFCDVQRNGRDDVAHSPICCCCVQCVVGSLLIENCWTGNRIVCSVWKWMHYCACGTIVYQFPFNQCDTSPCFVIARGSGYEICTNAYHLWTELLTTGTGHARGSVSLFWIGFVCNFAMTEAGYENR